MSRRLALTDLDTGELLPYPPRRTKRRPIRSRAPRRIKSQHESFVVLAAVLGLWIAIIK